MANLSREDLSIAPVNETEYLARTYTVDTNVRAGDLVKINVGTGGVSPVLSTDAATVIYAGIALREVKAGGAVTCLCKGTLYGYNVSGSNNGVKIYAGDTAADVPATHAAGTPYAAGPGGLSTTAVAGKEVGVVLPLGSPARTDDGAGNVSLNADKLLWVDVTTGWVK